MKTQAGYGKKIRAAALFTDQEILEIRKADRAGRVTRKDMARMWGVSKETIARICRGDTYHWITEQDELLEEKENDPMTQEPTKEDVAASQEKLLAMLHQQNLGNLIIKEMEDDAK